MKKLVEKLLKVELRLSQERGAFELFALFLREDSPDRWDLLISSAWVAENKSEAIRLIVTKLKKVLSPNELIAISRVVTIDRGNPALDALHSAVQVEHSIAEVKNSNFFGLNIVHAYLITCKKITQANARTKKGGRDTHRPTREDETRENSKN